MNNFPLFTSIYKEVKDKDLTTTQKQTCIRNIKKLDLNGYELIYALIKYYSLHYGILEDTSTFVLPYEGVQEDKGVIFELNKFPVKLKQMIYNFVNKHLKKMKDDAKRRRKSKVT